MKGSTRTHRCPPDHKHGLNGTCYVTHKCGCEDCRRGRAEYQYWRVAHRNRVPFVDATGTRRRLQALAALGWSSRALGERVGYSEATISHWTRAERVTNRTARKVARWYDELSMMVPPTVTRLQRVSVGATKGRARAAGWVPPLAWDDQTIDDPNAVPSLTGERVTVLDELDHLRQMGESASHAVAAVGGSAVALERMAQRKDRHDLAAWVRAA